MILLAIDTSSHASAACLYDSAAGELLAEDSRDIGRGHAEILMDQIGGCLDSAGKKYDDLERIGVASGPGSFTGVRVGIAAAKGIGIGLDIPVVGISCLSACESAAICAGADTPLLSVLDARRDEYYCKLSTGDDVWVASGETLGRDYSGKISSLAGSGAKAVAHFLESTYPIVHEYAAAPIRVYAELAAVPSDDGAHATPVYLRSADAKPQSGFALKRSGH